ncbi:MAG: murein biosynthesis integral membrane protein MurJ, partial [Deltaproteobacteria bacterium]|nr:murein biosynthesis integral membrane protein MurJ [Deltaproteobacteria bacterium]
GYVRGEDRRELQQFLSAFLTLFSLFLAAFTGLMILLAPWIVRTFFDGFDTVPGKVALTILLTQLMFPYLLLVCLAAVFQAALNSFRVFAPSAATPILLNLAIILAAVALHDRFPDPSYALAVGFLAGGVLQAGFQVPWLLRLGLHLRPSFRWSHPGLRELLRVFAPGVFSAGIYQINVFVSEVIATGLPQGTLASLQYSTRLQELVLGVFVISVTTVVLPTFARQFAERSHGQVADTLRFSLGLLALIALPATTGLMVLGEPIIRLLFQYGRFDAESTRLTTFAVLFHAPGIYFIAASRTLSQVFYGTKDLRTPAWTAGAAMLVNVGLCLALAGPLGNGGVAAANTLSAVVSTVLLAALLGRTGVRAPFAAHGRTLLRALVAAGGMVAVLLGLGLALPLGPELGRRALGLRLLGTILAGAAAYGLLLILLARGEVGELRALLRRRTRAR